MIKIMLIEDDFDNREILADCLRMENYHVDSFENGTEALNSLKENAHPDILLMDLCFPDHSPESFVKKFHELTGHRDIPVIVLSGKADIKKISAQIMARKFLQKPYDLFKLYEEILNVLAKQSGNLIAS